MRRLLVLAALFFAFPSHAVTLMPGDVLVLAFSPPNAVAKVDPATGGGEVISSGGSLGGVQGLTIGPNAEVFVSDTYWTLPEGRLSAVYQIDPATGAQTLVTSDVLGPGGMAVEEDGDLLVADFWQGAVLRVNVSSGNTTTLSTGGNLITPYGIAVAGNGDIFVTDSSAGGGGGLTGLIIRIDPVSGHQTIISSGGFLSGELRDIAIDSNGDLFVADSFSNAVFRIHPLTGAQTLVSSGGSFLQPQGLAFDATGGLLVGDGDAHAIFAVNPTTGAQSTFWDSGGSGGFTMSGRLATVPIPEPSTALLLASGLAGLAAVGRRRQ